MDALRPPSSFFSWRHAYLLAGAPLLSLYGIVSVVTRHTFFPRFFHLGHDHRIDGPPAVGIGVAWIGLGALLFFSHFPDGPRFNRLRLGGLAAGLLLAAGGIIAAGFGDLLGLF